MKNLLLFCSIFFFCISCTNPSPVTDTKEKGVFCAALKKMSKIDAGHIYEIPATGLASLELNKVNEEWGLKHLVHLEVFKHYFGPRAEYIPADITREVYFHSYIEDKSTEGNCIAVLGTRFVIDADEESLYWVEFDAEKAIRVFQLAHRIEVGDGSKVVTSLMKDDFTLERTTIDERVEEPIEKTLEVFVRENGVFEKRS